VITIHQRYRQTDRQTTCDRNTALCTKVHRAVKTICTCLNVEMSEYVRLSPDSNKKLSYRWGTARQRHITLDWAVYLRTMRL